VASATAIAPDRRLSDHYLLGASTGFLGRWRGEWDELLVRSLSVSSFAAEFAALSEPEFAGLARFLKDRPRLPFVYLSVHAPVKEREASEETLVDWLWALSPRVESIVVHPARLASRSLRFSSSTAVRSRAANRAGKSTPARKLLFSSGLLPVLECHSRNTDEIPGFLAERFALLPTDRVAEAFLAYGAVDPGLRTFRAYDEFLRLLNDSYFRAALKALAFEDADDSSEFQRVRHLGREFQAGLLSLLFDTHELYPLVREFAIY
jgi:hypothetical protein